MLPSSMLDGRLQYRDRYVPTVKTKRKGGFLYFYYCFPNIYLLIKLSDLKVHGIIRTQLFGKCGEMCSRFQSMALRTPIETGQSLTRTRARTTITTT